eukprot:227058_1
MLPSNLGGYAEFPGGPSKYDGIVINSLAFGSHYYDYKDSWPWFENYDFNFGRVTTHEIGHWLNLFHIWGDGDCEHDDLVDDTPLSEGPYGSCPSYPQNS